MEKSPLVSICMPAYNAEKYIAEAIQSIINQTYNNWELIIVDDGSTDATGSIAKSFTGERISTYHQENKGQCAAANKAYSLSKGGLIKFFDADDILSPGFIQSQVVKLNNNCDCVASAQWGRFSNDDLKTFNLNYEEVWKDLATDEWLVRSWKNARPMMQCGLWLIPRKIVERAGLWDERLSLINDFDFFTRVLINSRMVLFTPGATLYYRSGIQNSLSGTKNRKAYESAFLSIEKATAALLAVRDDNEAKLSCANIWQNFIYEMYPGHKNILHKAYSKLQYLPKPSLKFPCGGYTMMLNGIFGWKVTKLLKQVLYNN
jgi:glycosyltransferase involved in cell wall biosynthesis